MADSLRDEKQRLHEIARTLDGPLGQIYRLVYRPHLRGLEEAATQIVQALRDNPSPKNLGTAKAAIHGLNVAGVSFMARGLEAAVNAAETASEPELPGTAVELYADPVLEATCSVAIADFQAINDELIEHFARHPEDLHQLKWRTFEELLEAIFRNQGYGTELGPGRGDSGVDLRLIQKDSVGELVTLVQAKCYAPENPIELEAVAALHGVVEDQRASRGLFVTTSRYLPVARQFAERRRQRLVLATSTDVAAWCNEIVVRRRKPA